MSGESGLTYSLPRLLGLHVLSGARFARLIGVSTQYVWMLLNGDRVPTDERLEEIAGIFGIRPERLEGAPFEELLAVEIADPRRYRETEERIAALERRAERRSRRSSAT